MANETTTTSQAALIATEVLADGAIQANLPRMVFLGHVHHDSIDGAGSSQKRYPVESDKGAASAGTETMDLTPTVELDMATSVNVTTTEGVAEMALITEDTVLERLGGMPSDTVLGVFQSEDEAMLQRVLAPDIRRLTAMGVQKIESDGLAELGTIANTVGSTGVDVTIVNLIEAVFQLKKQQPHRPASEWEYILTPNQVQEITLEAVGTSGGIGGTIWTQQAPISVQNRQDDVLENGFAGVFLGYNVYEYDHELRVLVNASADVAGAFGCFGRNLPSVTPDDPSLGGRVGFGVYLERHGIRFRFQYDASFRAMELIMNARYGWGTLVDTNAVGIYTDAPA